MAKKAVARRKSVRPKKEKVVDELPQKIARLAIVNAAKKEAELEEKKLKAWFKERCGGEDACFQNDTHEVVTTNKSRAAHEVAACEYIEVTVRERKEAAA